MKFDNYDRLSRSLDILRDGLSNYIVTQLKENYRDEWWQKGIIKPLDEASKDKQLNSNVTSENCWSELDLPQMFWIITYWETWNSVFSKNNGKYNKDTVNNLRKIRNQHAHTNKNSNVFSNEITTKNLESMIDFLKGIGKNLEAEKIRVLKNKKFNNIPYPRNNSFVGREDHLIDIKNKFGQNISCKNNIILLTGLGGIGKTQLALEFAYRYQDQYTDGIFWVNSASGFQAEFISVASNFVSNILLEKEIRENEVVKLFFDYLDDNPNALIVIDNLDHSNILNKPILGLIPTNLSGNVLITSRRETKQSGVNSIEVKGIEPDDAISLLLSGPSRKKIFENQSSDSINIENAFFVCSIFGYHPLAISRASTFLERFPNISIADFLHRIRSKGSYKTLVEIGDDRENQFMDYPSPIIRLFQLMWESLDKEDSIRILQIMALFDDMTPIPLSLFKILANISEENKDPGEPDQLDFILEDLIKLRFIEVQIIYKSSFSLDYFTQDAISDSNSGNIRKKEIEQRFYMHPLIQDFIKQTIPDKENLIKSCYLLFSEMFRNPEKMQINLIDKGVDRIIDEIHSIELLISKSSNLWMDFDSTLFFYKSILKKESHNIREWNMVDLLVRVSIPAIFFNPRMLPGFALQQIYNQLFLEDHEHAHIYFEYLRDKKINALIETKKIKNDSIFLEKTLVGHEMGIRDVVLTKDDKFLISSSYDGTIKIWDVETGKPVLDTIYQENSILFTSINTENERVILDLDFFNKYIDNEDFLKRINVTNINENAIYLNPNSEIDNYAFSYPDDSIYIWELESGKIINSFNELWETNDYAFLGFPLAIFYSKEFNYLINCFTSGVRIWDLTDSKEKFHFRFSDVHRFYPPLFIAQKNLLLIGNSTGDLIILDIFSEAKIVQKLHEAGIKKIYYSHKESRLITASEDGLIKVWNWDETELILSHEFGDQNNSVENFDLFSKEEVLISCHSDGCLRVWDLNSGRKINTFIGHGDVVEGVLIASDDNRAFSISRDLTIKIWNLTQIMDRKSDDDILLIPGKKIIVKDSKFAITTGLNSVKLIDLENQEEVSKIEFEDENINSIIMTEDHQKVIVYGKYIYTWDLRDKPSDYIDLNFDSHSREILYVTSNSKWIISKYEILFSEELQEYVEIDDPFNEGDFFSRDFIEIWDFDSQKIICSFINEDFRFNNYLINESGSILFAIHRPYNRNYVDNNPSLCYWIISDNGSFDFDNRIEFPDGISIISNNNKFVLIDRPDRIFVIQDLVNFDTLTYLSFGPSNFYVTEFEISSDNLFAAFILSDGSIHLWDLCDCKCKAVLPGSFSSCSFTIDGSMLLAVDNKGLIHFLKYLNYDS